MTQDKRERSTKRRPWLLLALGAVVAGLAALFAFMVIQSREVAEGIERPGSFERQAERTSTTTLRGASESQGRSVLQSQGTPSGPSTWIRVLDRATGAGIPGAQVRLRAPVQESQRLSGDASGRVDLPGPGPWRLEVRAEGYVRRRFVGEVAHGEHLLHLDRAGAIEVRVRRIDDTPVPNATLVLIPPTSEGMPLSSAWSPWTVERTLDMQLDRVATTDAESGRAASRLSPFDPSRPQSVHETRAGEFLSAAVVASLEPEGWVGTSSELGLVRWGGLVPGNGYRVEWRGPGAAALVPSDEESRFQLVDGRVFLRGGPQRTRTTPLTVSAGESTTVQAIRALPGRIHGVLDTAEGTLIAPSSVSLHHWNNEGSAGALAGWDLEGVVVPNLEGHFEFDDVRVGRFKVSAEWTLLEGVHQFAVREFELGPGEVRDLGTLSPLPGGDLVVELFLIDQDELELPPEEVFADPESVQLELSISADAIVPGATSSIWTELSVRPGARLVLRGLPAGEASLRAGVFPGDRPRLRAGFGLEPTSRLQFEVPAQGLARVPVRILRRAPVVLRVRLPEPGAFPDLRLLALLEGPADSLEVDLPTRDQDRVTTEREFEFELPIGRHRVLLHDHLDPRAVAGTGVVWMGELAITRPGELHEIQLERGATLGGRLLGTQGRSGGRSPSVHVGLAGWELERGPFQLYYSKVLEDGSYRVRGLPSRTDLRVLASRRTGLPELEFRTGPPGSHTILDLQPER